MLFILGARQYSPSSAHPNEDRPMSRLANLLFGNLMLVAIAQAAPLEPPKLDITGACRDTAAQHDAATRADVLKSCVESENRARKELQEKWSRFDPTIRAACVGASAVGGSVKPSYSELIGCIEMRSR